MYYAFGLKIASQLQLPELLTVEGPRALSEGNVDVHVRFGPVPASMPAAQDRGICFQTAPSRALIALDDVARFDIRDGREIVIERAAGVCDSTLRLFVLGYCMGTLLHQRGLLVLHASVVARGDNCLAQCGRIGGGGHISVGQRSLFDRG